MKFATKSKVEPQPKPLIESAKTVGDWIKIQRERKNLTPGHVALKMGIAHASVLAWESNASEPDSQQMAGLAKALGLDADAFVVPSGLPRQAETA